MENSEEVSFVMHINKSVVGKWSVGEYVLVCFGVASICIRKPIDEFWFQFSIWGVKWWAERNTKEQINYLGCTEREEASHDKSFQWICWACESPAIEVSMELHHRPMCTGYYDFMTPFTLDSSEASFDDGEYTYISKSSPPLMCSVTGSTQMQQVSRSSIYILNHTHIHTITNV